MRADDLDPAFERAIDAGWIPDEESEGERMPEDLLHEHRCPCGNYWSCRRVDCTADDRCDECDDRELAEWMDQHDPQPELQLISEEN